MLVFPGFQLLDAAGPIAAFEAAGGYVPAVVAATPGPVASSSGVTWLARPLPRPREVDTLLVAGGDGVDAALDDAKLLRFVRRMAAARVRIASICSGSLLLAAAGLLDGRSATTHWSRTRAFRERFPQVRLEADRIYVRECGGALWSSAGITAGIDLALALVAEDRGSEVARSAARQLVVYYRRPGGQSQFSALLDLQGPQGRFDALLDHVRRHLGKRHTVDDLARQACMSPRHFAREFRACTGLTPAKAVERLRVQAAQAALEDGAASLQRVARDCGFGDTERMRRAFLRVLGTTPSATRRAA